MRYDSEHKQKTRQRILDEAASAIRAEGPHRVGVAGVMKKAGLTHGGFYAHFASKEEMVAEAIGAMFEGPYSRFEKQVAGLAPAEGLAAYVDFYLSPRHRDARDRGCPLPALAGDLARMEPEARERFAAGAEGLRRAVAGLLHAMGREDSDALASSAIAEMVGAMSLARAVADGERSDAILRTSREALKRRLGLDQGNP
ncbi:MAG: TetR family transcriptional regulator [Alphaproteobacteria bacterium]|nr:TetR family transcriptional regulator [Alphaproteobacteria bacterium]MDB5720445.1 TetR family transcriptional regulator [Alphaproteobacteria bacterium]